MASAMMRHPVMWPRDFRGGGTYGVKGHGYNPRILGSVGDLASWWAVPCNRTMVLAAVAAALASGLATYGLRKQEKKRRGAG
jgi:hypothetical protein